MSHMSCFPWVGNASVSEILYDQGRLCAVKIDQKENLEHLVSTLPANV